MLAMGLCAILFKSTMEMFAFAAYYPYYAIPFQILIPLVVWIGGEIHVKRNKQQGQAAA
jgi:spore germination protein KB